MVNYNRGLVMKESNFKQNKCWGGKRECSGRKKTCRKNSRRLCGTAKQRR